MSQPSANQPSTLPLLAVFAAGIAWWISFQYNTGRTMEDALITYRYAQNIASGAGFVFNAGEPVLGTTTPLLTLWLALWGKILGTDAIPMVSRVSMMILGAGTAGINILILRRLKCTSAVTVAATALFFLNYRVIVTSIGGMETPMVLFFMALSGYALLRERDTLATVSCAALILTRIDGVIWSAVIFALVIFRRRSLPVQPLAAGALVLLPWFAFAWSYFGSVIPHAVVAKRAIQSANLDPGSWSGLLDFGFWYGYSIGFKLWSYMGALFLVLIAVGTRRLAWAGASLRSSPLDFALVFFVPAYGLFLFAGRAPHFFWYLVPSIWCVLLIAAVGLDELVVKVTSQVRSAAGRMSIVGAMTFAVVLFYGISHVKRLIPFEQHYQANENQTRRAIGEWLNNNTPEHSTVAMEAIGYQGYFSNRKIIDLAGIVSPRVVDIADQTSTTAASFHRILTDLNPAYLVLRSFEVDENQSFAGGALFDSPAQRQYFDNHYQEVERFAAPYPDVWLRLSFLTIYGPREQ